MKWWDWMPWSLFFECWVLSQFFHCPLSLHQETLQFLFTSSRKLHNSIIPSHSSDLHTYFHTLKPATLIAGIIFWPTGLPHPCTSCLLVFQLWLDHWFFSNSRDFTWFHLSSCFLFQVCLQSSSPSFTPLLMIKITEWYSTLVLLHLNVTAETTIQEGMFHKQVLLVGKIILSTI